MKAKSARRPKKEPPTPLLQKWHRNNIFEAIKEVALDPREFDLKDSGAEVRIKHKWSESCLIVRRESGYYAGQSVVGDGPVWPYSPCSWQTLIPRVSTWLEEVKRDLETPDLWAELQREGELLRVGSNEVTENTPFTPEEQREIARRLKKLAKHVRKTQPFSQMQMQALDEKLNYLVDASGRLGRKDWLNAFIGVTLAFMLGTALPQESARTIFMTFLQAIGLFYPELPIE
jgi:hypothetical protein